MTKFMLTLALALVGCALSADRASAQYPCYGGFGGFGGGYGSAYATSSTDRPPFYAMFPPVYYSYPVARTYGYSPFAYPPGTMTPEIIEPTNPETIVNPHVKESSAPAPQIANPNKTAMASSPDRVQVTDNPFVPTIQAQVTAK